MIILSTAYCAPIEYYALIASNQGVLLDSTENYTKQTYRNRCTILTANGPLDLRVPIVHNGARRIVDVLVDWSTPWARQSLYAVESAYCSSPFYEYYRDEFEAIFERRPETLWKLDESLMQFFCAKIGIPAPGVWSGPSGETPGASLIDINPKHPSGYSGKAYWQVFREKFGFTQNLSIMDLLFNEGPESLGYLL